MPVEVEKYLKSKVWAYKVMFKGEQAGSTGEAFWYGLKLDEVDGKIRLVEIAAIHPVWGGSSSGVGRLHVVDPSEIVSRDKVLLDYLKRYEKWCAKNEWEYDEPQTDEERGELAAESAGSE
jgi:hypothetical protein